MASESAYQYFILDVATTLSRSAWDRHNILLRLKYLAEKWGVKLGEVTMPCRIAITGTTVSEPVDQLLEIVDKEKALAAILRYGGWPDDPHGLLDALHGR